VPARGRPDPPRRRPRSPGPANPSTATPHRNAQPRSGRSGNSPDRTPRTGGPSQRSSSPKRRTPPTTDGTSSLLTLTSPRDRRQARVVRNEKWTKPNCCGSPVVARAAPPSNRVRRALPVGRPAANGGGQRCVSRQPASHLHPKRRRSSPDPSRMVAPVWGRRTDGQHLAASPHVERPAIAFRT
jgi:hypothetical protein